MYRKPQQISDYQSQSIYQSKPIHLSGPYSDRLQNNIYEDGEPKTVKSLSAQYQQPIQYQQQQQQIYQQSQNLYGQNYYSHEKNYIDRRDLYQQRELSNLRTKSIQSKDNQNQASEYQYNQTKYIPNTNTIFQNSTITFKNDKVNELQYQKNSHNFSDKKSSAENHYKENYNSLINTKKGEEENNNNNLYTKSTIIQRPITSLKVKDAYQSLEADPYRYYYNSNSSSIPINSTQNVNNKKNNNIDNTPPSSSTTHQKLLKTGVIDSTSSNNKTKRLFQFQNQQELDDIKIPKSRNNNNDYKSNSNNCNNSETGYFKNNTLSTKSQELNNQDNFQPVSRTMLLLQTLCNTYQKDRVFAQSILKLVQELSDEIQLKQKLSNNQSQKDLSLMNHNNQNLIAKIQQLEEKKKYYKNMAKSMKIDIQNYKKSNSQIQNLVQDLKERDKIINTMKQSIISQQTILIESGQFQQKVGTVPVQEEKLKQVTTIKKQTQNNDDIVNVMDIGMVQQSFDQNSQFKELVNECDNYLKDYNPQTYFIDKKLNLNEKEKLIIKDIQQNIFNCQTASQIYFNHFKTKDQMEFVFNFDKILSFINELVLKIKYYDVNIGEQKKQYQQQQKQQKSQLTPKPKITLKRQDDQISSQEKINIESIKEMKEKLLKEITEQLDVKLQQRLMQTLDQSSTINSQDLVISNYNQNKDKDKVSDRKSFNNKLQQQQYFNSVKRGENIQSQNQSFVSQCSDSSPAIRKEESKSQIKQQNNNNNTSSKTFVRNCSCSPISQQQHQNDNNQNRFEQSYNKNNNKTNNNQQNAVQQNSRPTIKSKGNNQKSQATKEINTGLEKFNEISINLRRHHREGSFIVGCDGDAAVIKESFFDNEYDRNHELRTGVGMAMPSQKNQKIDISDYKKEDLNRKLSIAEEKLKNIKNESKNAKLHNHQHYDDQSNNIRIIQTMSIKEEEKAESVEGYDEKINLQEIFSDQIIDDEMLLSDYDTNQQNKQKQLLQQIQYDDNKTASFNNTQKLDSNNKIIDDQIVSNQKQTMSKKLENHNSQPNLNQNQALTTVNEASSQKDSAKLTATPKDQISTGYNKFGFRYRQSTINNNNSKNNNNSNNISVAQMKN